MRAEMPNMERLKAFFIGKRKMAYLLSSISYQSKTWMCVFGNNSSLNMFLGKSAEEGFAAIDKDKNGRISQDEIAEWMSLNLSQEMPGGKLNKIVWTALAGEDGEISLEELEKFGSESSFQKLLAAGDPAAAAEAAGLAGLLTDSAKLFG